MPYEHLPGAMVIFYIDNNDKLVYKANEDSDAFKIVMHSKAGLLPAVRFHLEDSHLSKDSILGNDEVAKNMNENDGFLSLDFVFEKNFKDAFREQQPGFYEQIKDMHIEDFVERMMSVRERLDAFTLLKAEYAEAEKIYKEKRICLLERNACSAKLCHELPGKTFFCRRYIEAAKSIDAVNISSYLRLHHKTHVKNCLHCMMQVFLI